LNADDHSAVWISFNRSLDRWTAQFFSNQPPKPHPMPNYLAGLERAVLSTPAPLLDLASPIADVRARESQADLRRIDINVRSQTDVGTLFLRFDKEVQPLSLKVEGREIVPILHSGSFTIALFGMGAKSTNLELTLKAPASSYFWLTDQSFGLPAGAPPRPNDVMATEGSDVTTVCRKYSRSETPATAFSIQRLGCYIQRGARSTPAVRQTRKGRNQTRTGT
jgi:hypothetical protein